MEEYDFQNIFELIGIESFDDPEYLKTKISGVCVKIKNNISTENRKKEMKLRFDILDCKKEKEEKIKEYQSLNKSDEEIENLKRKYDETIEKLTKEADYLHDSIKKLREQLDTYATTLRNSDNIFELLYHYLVLESFVVNDGNRSGSIDYGKELTEQEKEHKKLVNYANTKFKSTQSVEKYIYDKVYPLEYIDVDNRDMSKYGYYREPKKDDPNAVPDHVYRTFMKDTPKKLIDTITYSGENIEVYDIGKFTFGQWITRDEETKRLHATHTSSGYTIVSVVRTDENGNKQVDNGVIYLVESDMNENKEFYANVVFSKLAMRNANENNFGFIGQVDSDEYNEKMLCYKEVETEDLVRSLAYAQRYPGTSGKTLPEVIKKANERLLEDKIPDNSDEGGR